MKERRGLSRRRILQAVGGAAAGLSVQPASAQGVKTASKMEQVHRTELRLTINGQPHRLEVDIRTSLLDLLREHLHLTGTKKGCNQGACGACTVLVNDLRINSCLTLAVMHQGAEITTIEGVASGDELHPLQAAFIEQDAFQCGYCTPGQIVSGIACIREGHADSAGEIRRWMSGNICRCGAYPNIVAAVAEAAKEG
jgi:xanthine dehydrogenase YagT iron-sulfur-binding subunit